jgi:Nitroreductase family
MIAEKFVNPVDRKVTEPVAKRWSPRAYSSKPIEQEKLLTVLEAARWSASSYNEQPWRFIVASKENPEAYSKLLSCLNDWNQKWANLAPVLVLTIAKKTFGNGNLNRHAWHDMGQIVATLGLEAAQHDLYIHQMAGIHADKAKALYNVPDDYDVVSAFTLGYLGDVQNLPEEFRKNEKGVRTRKPLSELVFEDEFGKTASVLK